MFNHDNLFNTYSSSNSSSIGVFISHSWKYSNVYNQLKDWIDDPINLNPVNPYSRQLRKVTNYSVPEENPIQNCPWDYQLREKISNKINKSNIFIVPAAMYVQYSKWIQEEIAIIRKHTNKKILVVKPWRQQRSPSDLYCLADTIVGWKRESIRNGIAELYCDIKGLKFGQYD